MGRHKPPASPAEAAEREATRAAKLEQLHATLAEQVGAIREGEDWQRWLTVAAKFPSYSFSNTLLIASQRPDATQVQGFHAWGALGRQVNKGAKGITILAPMIRRPKAGTGPVGDGPAANPTEVDPGRTAAGNETTAVTNPTSHTAVGATSERPVGSRPGGVAGFRVVHVFDISDTSGQPLPERPMPELLAGQAPPGLWDALATQVQARGFELTRGDCSGANGLTHFLDRTVTVRADVDDAQAVRTLLHELGHVLMHDPTGLAAGTVPAAAVSLGDPALAPETVDLGVGRCRGRLEVEAESGAYLVASTHGLEAGAYTFPYVAGWAFSVGGVEVDQVVRGTANRVLAAAKVVLVGTEHLLGQTGDDRVLEQDLTLADDAARGAVRTAALLTAAVATAESTQQLAATVLTAPSVAVAAGVAALTAGPATAAAGPSPVRLMEVHSLAVDFYAERLHTGGPDARRAVALLTERGVDRDTAAKARLGYAPRAWTNLVDHLCQVGVNDAELSASGLVLESSRGTLVDRFRDRVIFPVETLAGQTVALLGRAVEDTATDRSGTPIPKYLNSPHTAIYRKGEHLYGLGQDAVAAIATGARPVLVEGPMDVLAVNRIVASPASRGQTHFGVASCGTALTAQQVQLLDTVTGGLAERGVVTAYDGDDAGRQASLRAYDLLTATQAWPTVLDLPAGQDPASLAAEHGATGLHAALLAAAGKPLADLVVDQRIARHHLRWPEGQVAAGRDATAVVAAMPPEHVPRQIRRISAHTGLAAWTVSDLLIDAVTDPNRTLGNSGPEAHVTAHPPTSATTPPPASMPASVPPAAPYPAPASVGAQSATSNQTPPQRARAGFPVALHASLRPPAPATLGTSPPAVTPQPDQHHHTRTSTPWLGRDKAG